MFKNSILFNLFNNFLFVSLFKIFIKLMKIEYLVGLKFESAVRVFENLKVSDNNELFKMEFLVIVAKKLKRLRDSVIQDVFEDLFFAGVTENLQKVLYFGVVVGIFVDEEFFDF